MCVAAADVGTTKLYAASAARPRVPAALLDACVLEVPLDFDTTRLPLLTAWSCDEASKPQAVPKQPSIPQLDVVAECPQRTARPQRAAQVHHAHTRQHVNKQVPWKIRQ
jgi:hypothetical protein